MSILTSIQLPIRIWKALQGKFTLENTTTFHHQFAQLLNLSIDSKSDMADKLTEVEIQRTRLQT